MNPWILEQCAASTILDHTADIRLLLRKLVIRGVIGLVLVTIFAVFSMFVLDDSREAATESNLIVWIVRIAWIFIALLFVASMLRLGFSRNRLDCVSEASARFGRRRGRSHW